MANHALGTTGLARTGSGLIVPKDLADQAPVVAGSVVRDADGRRRVVFDDSERRLIDRASKLLKSRGFAYIIGCFAGKDGKHEDGSQSCGQPMRAEDVDTQDAGYGCKCTRIHFRRW